MNFQPTTDLAPLVGRLVNVNRGQVARIQSIHHGAEATKCVEQLRDGVWGDCFYERPHDLPGGNSSFWWTYGTDLGVAS